jgi:hypothetical protein
MTATEAHAGRLQGPEVVVIPRWEWRIAEPAPSARIGALGIDPSAEAVSREVYLLSRVSPHNVKVRHGGLEVKRLERVTRHHVERWRPVLGCPLPINADDLGPVWEAWGIAAPPGGRPEYSLDQILAEIVEPDARLAAVRVAKQRARFTEAGCAAERARLDIGGEVWETFVLESEDPERVLHAIDTLGARLGGPLPDGTDFPAMLKYVLSTARSLSPKSGEHV